MHETNEEILNELRIEVAKQLDSLTHYKSYLSPWQSPAFMGKNKLHSVRLLKINKKKR